MNLTICKYFIHNRAQKIYQTFKLRTGHFKKKEKEQRIKKENKPRPALVSSLFCFCIAVFKTNTV